MSIRLKLEEQQIKDFKTLTTRIPLTGIKFNNLMFINSMYFLPSVGFRQVVGTSIDLVDSEESWTSSTCTVGVLVEFLK